jgi:hypothetical protein
MTRKTSHARCQEIKRNYNYYKSLFRHNTRVSSLYESLFQSILMSKLIVELLCWIRQVL